MDTVVKPRYDIVYKTII
ncbi:MAG TPA: hypothetical protein LFW20_02710 [Rickettsia endosymbiont of Omalisus fontisbellaquei]|nr:hypothetical protein [Rickettsia endosymbiont of Omalisus fontisbellaquei]